MNTPCCTTAAVAAGILPGLSATGCDTGVAEVASTGEPCTWGIECAGGVCLAEKVDGAPTGWKDGMCTQACGADGCGPGLSCGTLKCAASGQCTFGGGGMGG